MAYDSGGLSQGGGEESQNCGAELHIENVEGTDQLYLKKIWIGFSILLAYVNGLMKSKERQLEGASRPFYKSQDRLNSRTDMYLLLRTEKHYHESNWKRGREEECDEKDMTIR